jgi:hypothetical protein
MPMEERKMGELSFDVLRSDPRPEFADSLRHRLRELESREAPARGWPVRRIVSSAAAIGIVAVAFSLPAVRASAQSFLALFRVVNFVAVPVDPGRLDALNAQHLSVDELIGSQVQVVQEPGPPTDMASIEQAAAAAGIQAQVPQWLPEETRVIETAVTREGQLRVTADTKRLQDVMDALGIRDLRPPDGLDGQVVTVRVPPVVMIRYEHGKRHTRLFQARPPEIGLPAAVDMQTLGEIGLRMLGLDADRARSFAREIDWQTTLILPLPPTMTAMRQVDIAGHSGVLVGFQPPNEAYTNMALWSTGDRVFGLISVESAENVLAMANSIR